MIRSCTIRLGQVILAATILLGVSLSPVHGEASSPLEFDPHQGKILMEVTFGDQGEVVRSRVARSNAPYPVEVSTIEYVRKHWRLPLFAGETQLWPIVFDAASSLKWDADLTSPPNLYPVADLKREVTLRLTFGPDGWVSDATILTPSGDDSSDRLTAIWIKAHWHHGEYANKTIDAPFVFIRPAASAPLPPPPVKSKPKPVTPPSEPAPIPAMRVQ